MSKSKEMHLKIVTPEFVLSFPKLIKAEQIMGTGREYFSLQMLFDKGMDMKWLQDALKKVYADRWGDAKRPSTFKSPLHDGDTKADDSGAEVYRGKLFMNAKAGATEVITLLGPSKEVVKPERFYAGCICKASLILSSFDNNFGKGISVWLKGLQFRKDGDRLDAGGRGASKDDFDAVEGAQPINSVDDDF